MPYGAHEPLKCAAVRCSNVVWSRPWLCCLPPSGMGHIFQGAVAGRLTCSQWGSGKEMLQVDTAPTNQKSWGLVRPGEQRSYPDEWWCHSIWCFAAQFHLCITWPHGTQSTKCVLYQDLNCSFLKIAQVYFAPAGAQKYPDDHRCEWELRVLVPQYKRLELGKNLQLSVKNNLYFAKMFLFHQYIQYRIKC